MYKTSAELKAEAKQALNGRWKEAILLNIVPSLLKFLAVWGVALITILLSYLFWTSFQNGSFRSEEPKAEPYIINEWDDSLEIKQDVSRLMEEVRSETKFNLNLSSRYLSNTLFGLIISFMTIGISFTFLEVLRDPQRKINPRRDQFRMFNGENLVSLLLIQVFISIFTSLWSLLFWIPGLIKSYAYSQSFYIYKDLSEHDNPESLSAVDYITESKLLMDGHKGRRFYIDLSFIGWQILCVMTLGFGFFLLEPYKNATSAAFYRDISKDRYRKPVTDLEKAVELAEDEWTNF